jgi:hypothetical protein
MKNRLLSFGCSYTYGQGLSDCWDEKKLNYGPSPSKFAWPSLLGKDLDLEVYNFGIPGASNKHIWYTILNTEIFKNDIVVILWSYTLRHCFFKDDLSIQRLLPSDVGRQYKYENEKWTTHHFDETKFYYKNFYSNLDSSIESIGRIDHINYYLKSKNVSCYHFCVEDITLKTPVHWNNCVIYPVQFDQTLDIALDGLHPGEESQKNLSNYMLKIINRK